MKRPPQGKSKHRRPAEPAAPAPDWQRRLDGHAARLLLLALALGLQSIIFAPIDVWPAAYVCLVPWFIVVAVTSNATTVYLTSYLLGLGFFLVNLRWMSVCTVPGYLALVAYLAVYFPLVACPVRHAVRRRRFPLAVVAPVVWIASEMARAVAISGFPWLFLGHTQYRVLPVIQISDLAGAYAVSFVVVAINGAIADFLLHRVARRSADPGITPRRPLFSAVFAGALLLFALVYGAIQLGRDTSSPGPVVAVLQEDFPNFVDPDKASHQPGPYARARAYAELFPQAAQHRPDLFLLPETPWRMALNPELRRMDPSAPYVDDYLAYLLRLSNDSFDLLHRQAVDYNAYVVTGAVAVIPTPYALRSKDIKYNSAYVFSPSGGLPQRYDKVHCVYFGEVVPFRHGRLRFLYWWLNEIMPFSQYDDEYSLTPGAGFNVFSMTPRSDPSRTYRFGVPICYEDVMPYVSRRFVTDPQTGEKRVDFLLNISNDGWFVHSSELPQHLAICAFRAVENRVGIARAVNTGISGFVDPDGRIHDLVEVNGVSHGEGIHGYSVATVKTDTRHSVYSRVGDKFALACVVLGLLIYVDYVVVRARAGRNPDESPEDGA